MFFVVDSQNQTVTAHKKLGEAVRKALCKLSVDVSLGADPVKVFNTLNQDRFAVLNLSSAFESISVSGDVAAQELARQFQKAVDVLYER